jgi:hypothetical protein
MIFFLQFKKILWIRFLENLKNRSKINIKNFPFKKKGYCTCCADIKKMCKILPKEKEESWV